MMVRMNSPRGRKANNLRRKGKTPEAVTIVVYPDSGYGRGRRIAMSIHGTAATAMRRYRFYWDIYHKLHDATVWVEQIVPRGDLLNEEVLLEPKGGAAEGFDFLLKNFGIYQGEYTRKEK